MKILSVENLSRSFGGIKANDNISFEVEQGSILGIIGPNGAGKSTLFDLITGYTKADNGKVQFYDKNIFGLSPDKISNLGVGRTFQKLKPFADQTLLENVMIGSFVKEKNIKKARDKALEIIDFVDLIEKEYQDFQTNNVNWGWKTNYAYSVKQTKSENPEYKNQEGEWVNARFTSEDATYEEWYYIVDGKIQTWQQAKRLKAKRMPLKK